MSNAEIEDVLSSIRRLVTEDLRHQRPSRLTLGPSGFREPGDALVLTPAQRVAETVAAPAPHRPWSVGPDVLNIPVMTVPMRTGAQRENHEPEGGDALASLERTITELEAAVAGIEDEFESDTGEPLATGETGEDLHRMFEAAAEELPGEEQPDEAVHSFEAEHSAGDAEEDLTESSLAVAAGTEVGPEETPAAEIADLVETAGETMFETPDQAGWEDDLDTALTEGVIAGEAEVQAAVDVMALPEPTDPDDMWLADIDGHEEDAPVAALSDDMPATEAPVSSEVARDEGPAKDEGEPAGAAFLLAGTVTPRIHLTAARDGDRREPEEAEPIAEPLAEDPREDEQTPRPPRILRAAPPEGVTREEDPSEDSLFVESDEALVDADALRDLVAEIIRQELQGALGERITRNVRKLVRREINRVLESRSFE